MLVFLLVVLQRSRGVRHSTDIRHRIKQRLSLWSDAVNHKAMVTNTMAKVTSRTPGPRKAQSEELHHHAYNGMVLSGCLRKAVPNLTNCDQGGILDPSDPCTKTGHPVLEVLQEKHP